MTILLASSCATPAPAPSSPDSTPSGTTTAGSTVDPDACGDISAVEAGRRLHAFLRATAELQGQVASLHARVRKSCMDMGRALALPEDRLAGETSTICLNASAALREHMRGSVKADSEVIVYYEPAVCTVNMDAAATAVAACEATASADVAAGCSGVCEGSCYGGCHGSCEVRGPSGDCAGLCDGTCTGRCTGTCRGYADVDAAAECEAAAEVEVNVRAECTEPKLAWQVESTVVVDEAKLQKARQAILMTLPRILMIQAKLRGPVAQAFASWSASARGLYEGGAALATSFGKQSLCVLGQVAAAFSALAQIRVHIEVSVEATVAISGAANAEARTANSPPP